MKYAVEGDAVFWVEDLKADSRFDGNPFVHGESALRAYACAPVTLSNGSRIGAISIIDREPAPTTPTSPRRWRTSPPWSPRSGSAGGR